MQQENIFESRRSIFPVQYTGEKVSDTIIWDILKDANCAPSHRNSEPWRFQVYTDKAKTALAPSLELLYDKHTPIEQQKAIKRNKISKKLQLSSHIIVISMKVFDPPINPEWEEVASIGCAIQNIYLSCTSKKLGCYWSSPSYLVAKESALGLPSDEVCLGLVYIGIPKSDLVLEKAKGPIEEKVTWYK